MMEGLPKERSKATQKQSLRLSRPRTLPIISCLPDGVENTEANQLNKLPAENVDYGITFCSSSKCVQEKLAENQGNLFVKLDQFFCDPKFGNVVVVLLKDQLVRGLLTEQQLVSDLRAYCKARQKQSGNNCLLFIKCVHSVIANPHQEELIDLICKPQLSNAFIDIFQSSFSPIGKQDQPGCQSSNLEVFIKTANARKLMYNEHTKFIDMKLGFGETPLICALKSRCSDTTELLLRYGADFNVQWLGFQDALEVLLFSPNVVALDQSALENIKQCLHLVLQTVPGVNWKRLATVSQEYNALHPNWMTLIEEHFSKESTPSSLKHLCKIKIRQVLAKEWQLPDGMAKLPLPSSLQSCLHIQI